MKYFEWTFDAECHNSGFVDLPRYLVGNQEVDPWLFRKCRPLQLNDEVLVATTSLRQLNLDAVFGAFDLLFVSKRLADAIGALTGGDVQLLDLAIDGVCGEFYLVNVLREIACVDEVRSVYTKWGTESSQRPDKNGQYSGFYELRISSECIGGVDVFRPWGWHMALIVSERLRDLVQRFSIAGTVFRDVC